MIDGIRQEAPSHGKVIILVVVCAVLTTSDTVRANAQRNASAFRAEYTVEVRDTAARLFHVTATFSNLQQRYLDLALPVWTPGWYTIENYARNVLRLTVRDTSGTRLQAPRIRPQTWRLDTRRTNGITVEFDYLATALAVNQAKVSSQYAFFTGTQLFLEPIGHRDTPSTVRFVVPTGWQIVSALRESADSAVFTAANYDELVDAPTEIGLFDVARFEVDGKPHLLVTTPAGAHTADTVAAFVRMLPPIIRAQRAIFGSLPYDKYVFFYFRLEAESNAGGCLEHLNSHVCIAGGTQLNEGLLWSVAHEFFHVWNVKRIRPAEMWPYDYYRPNESPSLWVSEGVTSYYAPLTLYRVGVIADTTFLQDLAITMSTIESNEARLYLSPSDASVSTWIGYDTRLPFEISYYAQGQVLGALLDLSIQHDTRGQRGLDDVMRVLYREYYERKRGFTADDLIHVASAVAGRDYATFFRRYVTDVQVPPYDSIFAYAGYRLARSGRKLGVLGVYSDSTPQGRRVFIVLPGTPAALAGIRVGDVIVSVDGVPIHQVPLVFLFRWVVGKAGARTVLRILRDGNEQEVALTLGTYDEVDFRIESDPTATLEQLTVRSAWLRT